MSQIDQLQADHHNLQHLLHISTGVIDAYLIECYAQVPMLLPQNIVLSAFDHDSQVDYVAWHEHQLPVYHLHDHAMQQQGITLVIEGEQLSDRFALMCARMPESTRLRISEVVDVDTPVDDPAILHLVSVNGQIYHVPNIAYMQRQLGLL